MVYVTSLVKLGVVCAPVAGSVTRLLGTEMQTAKTCGDFLPSLKGTVQN